MLPPLLLQYLYAQTEDARIVEFGKVVTFPLRHARLSALSLIDRRTRAEGSLGSLPEGTTVTSRLALELGCNLADR